MSHDEVSELSERVYRLGTLCLLPTMSECDIAEVAALMTFLQLPADCVIKRSHPYFSQISAAMQRPIA